jgi:hypothetical protein
MVRAAGTDQPYADVEGLRTSLRTLPRKPEPRPTDLRLEIRRRAFGPTRYRCGIQL